MMAFHAPHRILSDGDSSRWPTLAIDPLPMSVYVLATTMPGTRAALRAAGSCARGLDARIVLLVPHVVPYVQTLEHPADPVAFVADRFRALAREIAVDIMIRICLCRPQSGALIALIPTDAAILIGGRTRRWWSTREQRLTRTLARTGRRVMFVVEDR
jgi:hypothetical protein